VEAAYACVARDGIGRVTVEGVAREAAVARATVYRTFPGGRDELVEAVVLWAVGEFFTGLAQDIGPVDGVATLLERGLVAGRRRLAEHEVLQHALQVEADAVMPALAPVMPVVVDQLQARLADRLRHERLRPGVDPDEAADVLARLVLSLLGTPGCWDMDDPAAVHTLVRDHLLAGILAAPIPEP
jgi:AcrR family transcriptional regulator